MKWTVLVLALVAVACGPSTRNDDDNFGGDGGHGSGSGGSGGSGNDGCSAASKLIYVVDNNNTLSQFDPTTKMFTDLGTLNCPGTGGSPNNPFASDYQPFSMGVDRNATAYVLFVDQNGLSTTPKLFKVDTTAQGLPCTATSFTSSTLQEFGMGFSTTTAGGDVDELFIAGGSNISTTSPSSLNTLDVSNYSPTPHGTVQGSPELTGNANAELWGFFPDATNARIVQINKADGTELQSHKLPASMQEAPGAWAFGFYGGSYYVFLGKQGTTTSDPTIVFEVDPTGTLMSTTPTNTRHIVGAGVSTCAPVVIE